MAAVLDNGQRSPAGEPVPARADDPLLECLSIVTRLHGQPITPESLASGLPIDELGLTPSQFVRAAERHELNARVLKRALGRIPKLVLPAVLLMRDGGACVLESFEGKAGARVIWPESGAGAVTVALGDLRGEYSGYCIFVHPRPRADHRAGLPAFTSAGSWFWGTMFRYRRYYAEAALATVMVNVLALGTALFIMNVYDRVVPNGAVETLTVLAGGVIMAILFEFLARNLRSYFLETAARKADVVLAGRLFEQALGLKMEARSPSAGTFAAQLREFESLRDFCTSATLTVLADLPFIVFFLWVISLVGGPLYKVPMVAVPLILAVGLLAQLPLALSMRRHVRESNQRHGLLVEAVEGMESLKTLNAEGRMQSKWEDYTAVTGRSGSRVRLISGAVVSFTGLVLQCVTIIIVVWGVFLIGDGTLSLGALIACVILTGRGLAPLSQVVGLLSRYQHARTAYFMLDELMRRPVERPPGRDFVQRETVSGEIEFQHVDFAYPGQTVPVLRDLDLLVRAGEKVAVLGRIGSGKTTLLKLVLGLYAPTSGAVRLDGADLRQYDPANLRRNVGYVAQDVRLFYGTLKENITLGTPHADDADVLEAARISGLDTLVGSHPMGFDLPVAERGEGLSGGQKQAVAITRALIRDPRVVLLDEATAGMDQATEQHFLEGFAGFARERTVIVVTHKPTMLALVDRVVVLDDGKIVADGPKDKVLSVLAGRGVAEGGTG